MNNYQALIAARNRALAAEPTPEITAALDLWERVIAVIKTPGVYPEELVPAIIMARLYISLPKIGQG